MIQAGTICIQHVYATNVARQDRSETKNIQAKYVDGYLNIFFMQFCCRRCCQIKNMSLI